MKNRNGSKISTKAAQLVRNSLLVVFAFLTINTMTVGAPGNEKSHSHITYSKAQQDLRMAMRKLWEEHITYTRNYIISALADLGDAETVAGRLLENQDDIGNAIKPYYGEEAGKKLSALLRDHILIAAEVVKEAKMNDKDALSAAQKKWIANADAIALFLSNANPNWNKNDLENALHKHLDLTTGEVTSRLKKDWKGDIASYDKGHEHILILADVLTNGIEKQFPKKF